jgi:hypothetical protein
MTDAFVVTYTARFVALRRIVEGTHLTSLNRPESIGEGRQRLFVSQNLGGSDGPLAKRILNDIRAVAMQSASLAERSGARPHKKARTGHISQRPMPSIAQGPGSPSPPPTVSSHATPTPRAGGAGHTAITSGRAGRMESSFGGEITTIVPLLKYVAHFLRRIPL